ncbi:MAG: PQQ-binding-like beta-propeller repeat protein [Planctomycetaceae bacterium]|nr:PQQ-binding-like beta-propeller repeat protein [Planctomycetaceae bacterium]
MRSPCAFPLVLTVIAALGCPAAADDAAPHTQNPNPKGYWNQFRGPAGNGTSTSTMLPTRWSETENVTWKTAIPGKAWSSPVVWGKQVWVSNSTEDGKTLSAVGIDLDTGKVVHDVTVFEIAEPQYCHPYNSPASGTPVIEEGRLWVHYGSAGTACLDTSTGRILWSRQDFPCNHHRGPGSSPILFENLLIINFDGYDFQYVVALDKETGRTVWKRNRDINYGSSNGDVKKAYSTPTVIRHAGRLQMIDPSSVATIAYDPRTGDELWKVYHGGFNAAARPLFGHGLVYINLEGGDRLLAVRPDGTGDVTKTHVAWKTMKSTPTRPSQILAGDSFFMVSDGGVVSCLNAATGEQRWTKRLGGPHCASLLHAPSTEYEHGILWIFDENGSARVIEADPKEYREVSENKLDAGCMASPAVAGDSLLVRTKTHLYRLDQKAE